MYNKNKLKKENEKKILKKRKKQWVVVSAATFMLLGSPLVDFGRQVHVVSADELSSSDSSSSESEASKETASTDKENQEANSTQEQQVKAESGATTAGAVGAVADGTVASDGVTAGLNDAKNLLDNQVEGKTASETLTQDYINNYNLAYKGFVDGTNYNSNSDGSSYDNLRGDSTDTTQQVYKDAYQQGKSYFDSTAYRLVRTPNQFRNAYKSSATRQILVMNNISLWSLSGTYGFATNSAGLKYADQAEQMIYFSNTDITINGRKKTVDYANYSFQNTASNIKMLMKDITMFGGNWFGPTKSDNSGSITYDNISYTGPQLINADNMSVTINNQVIVNGGQNYKPKEQTGMVDAAAPDYVASKGNIGGASNPITGSDQENMEVTNLTFTAGSHYIGSTFNSTALSVKNNGKVVLEQGAIVDLKPMGDGTSGSPSSPNGIAYGIYIPNGSMTVKENAQINIMPKVNTDMQKVNTSGYKNLAGAFYLGTGDVTLAKESQFNVVLDGSLSPNYADRNVVYIGGTMTLNAGKFSVKGQNLRTNNNTLVNVTGQLNANGLSTVNISAAGTGDVTLVQGAGMSINSPSTVGATFDIQGMQNSQNSKLFSGSNNLTSKNVSVNTGNGFVPYSSISFSMNGGDATGSNMNGQNQKAFTYSNTPGSQTKYVQFLAIPDFNFNQDMQIVVNDNGNYVLKGTMQTIASNANYNNQKDAIFLRLEDKNGNVVGNATISNTENKNDTLKYQQQIKSTAEDNPSVAYSFELPSNIDLNTITDYQLRGAYVISNKMTKISLTQEQIQTAIKEKIRKAIDAGIANFIANKTNSSYDPSSQSQYKSDVNYKLGYDAAASGYANPNSKTTSYTNGSDDYKYAYDKGQQNRLSDISSAKNEIEKQKNQTLADIKNDNTLTTAQKDLQTQNANSEALKANTNIENAKNAQGIIDAQTNGINAIKAAHQSQDSLDNQKAAAKSEIQAQKNQTLSDIENDNTLSNQQKADQKTAAEQQASIAEIIITQAQNAQEIVVAKTDGKSKIDSQHITGKSLDTQKAAANDAIDALAAQVNNAIDTDNTLSNQQKADQKAAVTTAVTQAKEAIKNATNAQGVIDAETNGINAIKAAHQSKDDVDTQKTAAKAEIQNQKTQTLSDIENDNTLSSQQKADQKAAVERETSAAEQAIDQVTNAQGIINATLEGKSKIDSQHVTGKSLDTQKAAANDAIDALAAQVNNAIDTDNTLSNQQKADQKAAVKTAVTQAKEAIKNATNAQGVIDAQSNGETAIKAAHQSKDDVDTQKTAAKAEIQNQKTQTLSDIENDNTLSNQQKADQKAAVERETSAAEQAIDRATNAQGIINATLEGKSKIDSQHVTGKSLDTQKAAANDAIDALAAQVNSAIDTDNTLSNQQKADQKATVTTAVTQAKEAIKNATNAQGVIVAQSNGETVIKAAHQSKDDVDTQKTAAKAEIQNQKTQTLSDIENDNTLSNQQKADQKAAVERETSAAEQAIDQATNAQGIIIAKINGIAQIAKQHVTNNQSLSELKLSNIAEIEAKRTEILTAIEKDGTLDNTTKAEQSAQATKAAEEATKAINSADNAQAILDAKTNGIETIKQAHKPGTSVDTQKTEAKAQIQTQLDATVDAISKDKTLTDAEQKAQTEAAKKAAEKANQAIDQAVDAQTVKNAVADGKTQIISQYKPGTVVDTQKQKALDEIEAKRTEILTAIEKDGTLDNATKAEQSAQATKAAEEATKAINSADNAQAILDAKTNGIETIKQAHKPGTPVDTQKTEAKAQIQTQLDATVDAISKDKTLTDAEQKAQTEAAKKAAEKANQAIDQAVDAQTVKNAVADGKTQIINQYKPGTVVDTQKQKALDEIEAKRTEILTAIEKDGTLDNTTKAEQSAQATKAAEEATKAINSADNAQAILDAKTNGIETIKQAHKPGTPVDTQKTEAKAQIQTQLDATVDAISKDKTLTDAEQKAQTEAAKKAAEKANQAIDQAVDAQTVKNAVADGKTQIIIQYKPGTVVDTQKQKALDEIEAKRTEILTAIEKDGTLDNTTKAEQSAQATKAAEEATKAINSADNAQAILDAKTNGIETIKQAHKPGTPVDTQKTEAKAQIQTQLDATVDAISKDKTLTDAEQKAQTEAAKKAAEKANQAIDQAVDAQTVKNAVADGKTQIISQYKPGTVVDTQKQKALDEIEAKRTEILTAIEKDGTLDNATKAEQSAQATKAAEEATKAINSADNAQAILDAKTNGIETIKQAHKPGTPVDTQKTEAKAQIQTQLDATVDAISKDKTLTDAEQKAQTEAAKKAAEKANQAIDQAVDAQTVKNAVADGKTQIINQYKPGTVVDTQKQKALDEIEAKRTEILTAIEKDGTLDNTTKAEQSAQATKAAEEATKAINSADNAQAILDAKTNGIETIKQAHKPGTPVDTQKTEAKAQIQTQLDATVDAISKDKTLTDAEQKAQTEAAKKAAEKANQAIDQAVDAQTVKNATESGKAQIIKEYQPGKIEVQKELAIEAIDKQAAQTMKDIAEDQTLSPFEKDQQKQALQKEADKAKANIQNAIDAQTVLDAESMGKTNILAQHKSNSTIYNPNETSDQLLNEKSRAIYQIKDYVNGESYVNRIKQATTFNEISDVLAEAQSQSGTIHYVPGYGVQQWILTNEGTFTQSVGTFISTNSIVKIYDQKVVDGIKYVRINSKDSNQWIQAQYLESATYQPVHYVPGYGVRIWSLDNNTATPLTGDTSIIPNGDSIRVLGNEKTVDGDVYVQIGSSSENKWIQKKYLQTPVLKEVNYVKGYGVQNWKFNADGTTSAIFGSYTPSNSIISTLDTRTFDGISYTRIGSAEQNVWVQTQYLV